MPTVLSVTLALGANELAKEGAIVARMSAVGEMAGMDILCSDKTGAAIWHRAPAWTMRAVMASCIVWVHLCACPWSMGRGAICHSRKRFSTGCPAPSIKT